MSTYRGHLTTVVGDGPEVVLELAGSSVRVLTPDGRVHEWPSGEVRVTSISGDRFWLAFDGEISVFTPDDPESFMLEFLPGLGTARTVADAIRAAEGPATNDGERDAVDETRSRFAAQGPRLPQLADHVRAGNGSSVREVAADRSPAEERPTRSWWRKIDQPAPCDHRWVETEQTAGVSLQVCAECGLEVDSPPRAGRPAESVAIDLTDEGVAAAEAFDPPADETDTSGEELTLLHGLASLHRDYRSGRQGTYKPRR